MIRSCPHCGTTLQRKGASCDHYEILEERRKRDTEKGIPGTSGSYRNKVPGFEGEYPLDKFRREEKQGTPGRTSRPPEQHAVVAGVLMSATVDPQERRAHP